MDRIAKSGGKEIELGQRDWGGMKAEPRQEHQKADAQHT